MKDSAGKEGSGGLGKSQKDSGGPGGQVAQKSLRKAVKHSEVKEGSGGLGKSQKDSGGPGGRLLRKASARP